MSQRENFSYLDDEKQKFAQSYAPGSIFETTKQEISFHYNTLVENEVINIEKQEELDILTKAEEEYKIELDKTEKNLKIQEIEIQKSYQDLKDYQKQEIDGLELQFLELQQRFIVLSKMSDKLKAKTKEIQAAQISLQQNQENTNKMIMKIEKEYEKLNAEQNNSFILKNNDLIQVVRIKIESNNEKIYEIQQEYEHVQDSLLSIKSQLINIQSTKRITQSKASILTKKIGKIANLIKKDKDNLLTKITKKQDKTNVFSANKAELNDNLSVLKKKTSDLMKIIKTKNLENHDIHEKITELNDELNKKPKLLEKINSMIKKIDFSKSLVFQENERCLELLSTLITKKNKTLKKHHGMSAQLTEMYKLETKYNQILPSLTSMNSDIEQSNLALNRMEERLEKATKRTEIKNEQNSKIIIEMRRLYKELKDKIQSEKEIYNELSKIKPKKIHIILKDKYYQNEKCDELRKEYEIVNQDLQKLRQQVSEKQDLFNRVSLQKTSMQNILQNRLKEIDRILSISTNSSKSKLTSQIKNLKILIEIKKEMLNDRCSLYAEKSTKFASFIRKYPCNDLINTNYLKRDSRTTEVITQICY